MASWKSALTWVSKTAMHVATDATWVFVIVMTLSLGSSLFSVSYISGLESDLGDLYENDIKGQTYAQNAYVTLMAVESALKDLILAGDGAERAAAADEVAKSSASLRTLVLKVTPTFDSAKYRTLIARSKRDATAFADAVQKLVAAIPSSPGIAEGRALLAGVDSQAGPLREDLLILNDLKRSANRDGLRAFRTQLRVSLGITIAILLVSVAVRVFLYRASRRSVKAG